MYKTSCEFSERRGKQLEGGGASDYKNFMAKKQKGES